MGDLILKTGNVLPDHIYKLIGELFVDPFIFAFFVINETIFTRAYDLSLSLKWLLYGYFLKEIFFRKMNPSSLGTVFP